MPAPAETPSVDPAARNRTGTTTPMPAPIAAKPRSAVGTQPVRRARVSPDAATRPPPRASATGPKRVFRRSPTLRLVAMASAKPVYASAATAAVAPTESER